MKKNTASQIIGAQLISKTDGSAVTSGTTTIYVTGDGGTQAAGSVGSGACTHEGNGYWTYAPATAETNYDQIGFTFVNTSACNVTIQVYPSFPQTGDNYARLGAPAGASVSADIAAMKIDTAAILVDTAEIGAAGAGLTVLATQTSVNTIDDFLDTEIGTIITDIAAVKADTAAILTDTGTTLDAAIAALPTAVENADALLGRNVAGGSSAGRLVKEALYVLRNKTAIAGGTLTVYGVDDTTSAFTAAVTTAAGDPIDSIDPA